MSRAAQLGLSVSDFRHFLIVTGRVSEFDMRINPAKICQLMSDDGLWHEYEAMAEKRASVGESGLLKNGGQKNAIAQEWRSNV